MLRNMCRVCLLVVVLVVSGVAAIGQTLVSSNSTWSYKKGTEEASSPRGAWRAGSFDDTSWARGQAPFYFDTGTTYRGNTQLSDMRALGYIGLYMRQKFNVQNAQEIGSLDLRFYCDDGFVVWINGTYVTNFNVTSTNPAFNSGSSTTAAEPLQWLGYTLRSASSYLQNGENTIAVQAFNRSTTSTDFIMDLELKANARDLTAPTIVSVSPAPGERTELTSITVTFSESVSGVGFSDLTINNAPATEMSGSGNTYTFSFPQPPYGPVEIGWEEGASITDFGDPANPFDSAATNATWTYTLVDRTAPKLVGIAPAMGNRVKTLQQIEATFSEPVVGVDAEDLLINGVPATSVTGSGAGPYLFKFPEVAEGSVTVSWRGNHELRDSATPANEFSPSSWNYTVDPNFTYEPVVITEFLTAYSGDQGLEDEDDELNDWIELQNRGSNAVNLRGWTLTDEVDEPDKWTFPDVVIQPGQFLVIFASGKDRKPTAPGSRLHTNFKLGSDGEYLALYDAESPQTLVSSFGEGYPEQRPDYSYGYDPAGNLRYFASPTPGTANGSSAVLGALPLVQFSVERGVYDAAVEVALTCADGEAQIRFTRDGSIPTATVGEIYSAPLSLSSNAVIRAVATKANHLPSTVVTHTYIFPAKVLTQPAAPPGMPTVWRDPQGRNWPADYEMDPEIVNHPDYSAQMIAALKALPALSIVTKPEDMFAPTTGIYPYSMQRGPAWERPASLEFIYPAEGRSVQINAGIQMQGNSVRDPTKTQKHAFRVVFKGDYGPSKLEHRVFPDSPLAEFDTLTIRADFNTTWMHWNPEQRVRHQRVRDAFVKDSQRAMSNLSAHNRYYHLYVNGLYWGIYDPTERPDNSFAAAYLGGSRSDYDVMNEQQLVDGSTTAYNTMLAISNLGDNSQYDLMKQYLDVKHHIDYTLLHFYVGHEDWFDGKNWYAIRRRAPGEGFKYIAWDGEMTLANPTINRVTLADQPGGLHPKLVANAQYRLDFADRVHKHMFNGGALTPDAVAQRFTNRLAEIELAMIAESARWGDHKRDVAQYQSGSQGGPPFALYTVNDHYKPEKTRLLTQYFPNRTATVLGQLRAVGLYPNVAAPAFNKHGGVVPANFELQITAAGGTIYYTTNGVDPRVLYTGAVASDAKVYTAPVTLEKSVQVKSRVWNGAEWSALNEAIFEVGGPAFTLALTEIMYHPVGGSPYEFLEFHNYGTTPIDLGGYSFDGLRYIFPPSAVLEPGAYLILASSLSPTSFATEYPGARVFGYFENALSNSGEEIELLDRSLQTVLAVRYDDGNGWPDAADGEGASLQLRGPGTDMNVAASWLAAAPTPGSATTYVEPLVPPTIASAVVTAETLRLTINGTPGVRYSLRSSNDLNAWTNDSSTNAPTATFTWDVPYDSAAAQRFFRIVAESQ